VCVPQSFNLIRDIQYDTFRFPKLEKLFLDDNRIETVDSKSFVEMTQLVQLSLEGNRLTHIPGKKWVDGWVWVCVCVCL
jgi:Leucine-rich repeat (LRR) protein